MSYRRRITKAFLNAKKLVLTEKSKFILFSDCHRGSGGFADDFIHNKQIYLQALDYYFHEGYTYIELGDGDELWENSFTSIFKANKEVYMLFKKFHDEQRLHFIWGNHDMSYKEKENIVKNYDYYFDEEEKKEFMKDVSFSEAIKLESKEGKSILLLHGHQADWFNYKCWKVSRFLVKVLWKPLQVVGVKDPTSPAKNFKSLIKVEEKIAEWIKENNGQMLITGHTHRPRFPLPGQLPYFNDGSCVHPNCITGIEITNNQITLVKWGNVYDEERQNKIKRNALEGPRKLNEYYKKYGGC